MIIFFDDRPVKIVRTNELTQADISQFDHISDLRLSKLRSIPLSGHVLLLNTNGSIALQVIEMLQTEPPRELLSITLATRDKASVVEKIKSLFKVIKAAGGVVVKENKWLLMYRRKKWDLPKGKLDKGETSRKAAMREIEEETGVTAVLKDKICTTWHTYTFNNNRILKRTKWYLLDCVDDSRLEPQQEEDIEKLEWLSPRQAQSVLINSYSSIRYVVECLQHMQNVTEHL
ncbi:NUDIX hydrolase [Telluribacter sp.]|jgi:8-oxo-dGTP pyrophosphatase MutT (NUDIX family)|uniref:NUDIX hydrolase n=1 Tax=Telluribacter sp. TaxID=1978767 RepID=UPI002E105012|nr:NUDIX hydrolase [Telluribacter sp.]